MRMKMFTGVIVMFTCLNLGGLVTQASAEPFIGEIRFFAGNFAPRGWALCNGQILDVSQHTALFAILGTTYGGDGRTTFALPDMRGRVLLHAGTGTGLSPKRIGQKGGSETNILTTAQMPSHIHDIEADIEVPVSLTEYAESTDQSQLRAKKNSGSSSGLALNEMTDVSEVTANGSTSATGEGAEVSNMPPYLTVNCIIALQGLFPPRN